MSIPAIEGGTPVREKKIYYGHQYLDQADYDAVVDVLKSDYLTCGPKIGQLEEKLCKLTGAKYAVVCSNGTAALHMAAMAAGLANGMGYLELSLVLTLIFGLATLVLETAFAMNARVTEKDLRITIPESLDYYHVFDDIFEKYLKRAELVRVKTTNMGSLYELEYAVTEADEEKEKEMIDAIRVRNGNLNIVCGRRDRGAEAL